MDEFAEIGVVHIASPWIGAQDSLDDYRAKTDQFNQVGETVNNAGLKFAYHNHAGSSPPQGLIDEFEEGDTRLEASIFLGFEAPGTGDWVDEKPV